LTAKGIAVTAEGQAKLERDKAVTEKERADTESATAKAVTEFLQKNLFEQVTGGGQPGTSPDLSVSGALDRAAARIEGTFEKQPLVEAGVREAIATAYITLSLYDKAEPQVERALVLRRRTQGEEDTELLNAMYLRAAIYANQRKFGEAESLLGRIVDVRRRKFGAEHPDTLKRAFDLASIYYLDEKLDKAEPLAVNVVEGRRRSLGPNDKETVQAMLVLATIYDKRQKIPQGLAVATTAYEASRRAFGEDDAVTLNAKYVWQGLNLKAANTPNDKAARNEILENRAKAAERRTATSLPEMIAFAANRATIAVSQGKPEDAEPPLLEALEASRRAGQEELNLTAILAGVYALQKKYVEAEAELRKVMAKPAALKDLGPNVVPFALRSLATGYRAEGKFAEAEPHLLRLVPLVLVTPGEANVQTRVDMFLLAENYANQRKYAEAEKAFNQLLDSQRRVTGSDATNTVVTISNVGWVRLQQKRYAEAEVRFREAAGILVRTAPDSWERFNVDSMLGASLAAQKKFEEAEPLLVSGYNGMGSARRTPNANNTSRFTQEQAGAAIVQFYADWGKPAKQDEWAEKLKAGKN
jgi:tetratricopeptide (TPR) repeat protein